MDAKKPVKKESRDIKELLEMYGKGMQLVSYGEPVWFDLPNGKQIELKKFPSGAIYVVRPYLKKGKQRFQLERFNQVWVDKMNRVIEEEKRINEEKSTREV